MKTFQKSVMRICSVLLMVLLISSSLVIPVSAKEGKEVRAENRNTGADSTNTITVEENTEVNVTIENTAVVENTIEVISNTGGNDVSHNTGSADISTGDATTNVSVETTVNHTQVSISCGGCSSGDVTVGNENTGAGSTNTADVSSSSQTNIDIDNDADIQNNLTIYQNTGGNDASYNNGNTSISTGDVSSNITVQNNANQSTVAIGFESGSGGGITVINKNTGAESTNVANVSATTNIEMDMTHHADIVNNLTLDAVTGENTASFNTGNGEIKTGDMTVTGGLETNVNQTEVFTFCSFCDPGDIYVENINTGFSSLNIVDPNTFFSFVLQEQKDMEVTNNVLLSALTGGNIASFNTGIGRIITGNIDITFGILTDGNRNHVFVGGPPQEDIGEEEGVEEETDGGEEENGVILAEAAETVKEVGGTVMGAAALPVTGATNTFLLLFLSGTAFFLGMKLRETAQSQ